MKCRKTVTEKKLAANRDNSKRSTGPRTERGKTNSKFNAVTLGLFAKYVVIPLCDGEGSPAEFKRLLEDLQKEHRPEGPSEAFWVVQIAECMWKLRRASFAERGVVQRTAKWEGKPPNPDVLAEPFLSILAILKKAQEDIETKGTLSREDFVVVLAILEGRPRDTMPTVEIDDQFLPSIKKKIKTMENLIGYSDFFTELRSEDYYAEHSLPPEAVVNLIHRYDKAAQRKLDWALQKLLESQLRRRQAQIPS